VKTDFDVVIIGAGHAGCEAAFAAARLGASVLLTTIDLNSVAYLACNPSIGGLGKSHLVYEIDALGGVMGELADKTCIQMRTLNRGNGPAVQALRAQVDKHDYHKSMLELIKATPNIKLKECEVAEILTKKIPLLGGVDTQSVGEVVLSDGTKITCKSVVVATGVYLNSCVLVGHTSKSSGPMGFAAAKRLTDSLLKLGLKIRRFKTGTPPRVTAASIDYTKTIPQPPDTQSHFSFLKRHKIRNVVDCHLTYTNEITHKIIRDNLKKSALFCGLIKGAGARYCPSIEDKIVRFSTANRHQVFLEPESLSTDEVYLQGISTSLPLDIQNKFVHSIEGLENARITKSAYAIEYDCIDSRQLTATLEYKGVRNLFFAGQVNGTSGYEEAAAQGLVAGVNAALKSPDTTNNKAKISESGFVLSRTESYIGVLIDDLVTLGTNEPYRMFTSRAEHRLYLRQDNADQRLTPLGREVGLVGDERWESFQEKLLLIEQYKKYPDGESPDYIRETVEIENKYAGYMKREATRMAEVKRMEQAIIPKDIDYDKITALRRESQMKLANIRPHNLAQAMRISGVTPADINVLLIWLKKNKV